MKVQGKILIVSAGNFELGYAPLTLADDLQNMKPVSSLMKAA